MTHSAVNLDSPIEGKSRRPAGVAAPEVCAHKEATPLFGAADPVTGETFNIVRCDRCGLARTQPAPAGNDLDRFYPRGYHRPSRRYRLGLDRALGLVHRARIRRMERLAGGAGRVLDIGCGPGWLLRQMRSRGWETRGTERSAEAAQQARDVFQLDVRAQTLQELIDEGITYDAVVLWHVAEHLEDPAISLHQIARLLRPRGVLMVAVPNFGSPEARWTRDHWFHLDVPRHLYHFTQETLSRLLDEAGFTPGRVVHMAPEYDVFSFVQSLENLLGLPANLLYDLLRRDEARLLGKGANPLASAAALTLAVPITLMGLVWTPLAAAMRRGATVTIYAERVAGR